MDYRLTVCERQYRTGETDRFDETKVGLHGNQNVRCNTTIDDGSNDIVRIVSQQVKADVAMVAGDYGKYVVYGVAGLVAFQLGKLWLRSRKKKGW